MGALLALGSAVCYGIADFAGGLLSRRAHPFSVALIGQLGGLVLTLAAVPLLPAADPRWADLCWGALSGVGTGFAMMFMYRGLSRGSMSVVVPVTAVGGVALPVLAGVVLLGDRPTILAWSGIVVAVPALWFVSRTRGSTGPMLTAATLDGLVASIGVALQYLALAQADAGSGLWPVVAGRLAAAVTIAAMIGAASRPNAASLPDAFSLRVRPRHVLSASLIGGGAALALTLYLLATREQLVAIAVVLSSLYPAIPVLLGVTVLAERLRRQQVAGLVAAGVAIVLLTAG